MFALIERVTRRYRKAAIFELADRGYRSPFELAVACVISIRTLDEVTVPSALRLFAKARTPPKLAALSVTAIDDAIRPSTFHEGKARTLKAIAERVVREGQPFPADRERLLSYRGIGPKCASLVAGVAAGTPAISVDTHVHRVVNRWGLVSARSPSTTAERLEEIVPERLWIDVNRLLMPFGKHVCTGQRPKCSSCPVAPWCLRIGVTRSR